MANLPTPYAGAEHEPFFWAGDGAGAALLVHGFPGTPAEMRPLAQVFHDAGWAAQGILLPGFGPQFPTIGERSAAEWLAAVDDALAALQARFERVILVGYSVGGALALQAAARRAPAGLVLVNPFWRVNSRLLDRAFVLLRPLFPEIRPFARADFADAEFRTNVLRVLPGADLDDPEVQAQVRGLALPTRVLGELRAAGQAGYAALPRVASPTLIVQAGGDPIAHPSLTRRMAARLPHLAGYVEVDGSHDLAHMARPEEEHAAEVVASFAAAVRAGKSGRVRA